MPSRDIYDLPPVPADTTRYANQTPMEFFGVDRLVPRLGAYDPEADLMAAYGRQMTPREAASKPYGISPFSTLHDLGTENRRPTADEFYTGSGRPILPVRIDNPVLGVGDRPGWGLAAQHEGVPVIAPQSIPTSGPARLPMSAMPDPSNPYQMRSPLAQAPVVGAGQGQGPALLPMREVGATLGALGVPLLLGRAAPTWGKVLSYHGGVAGNKLGQMGEDLYEGAYGAGQTLYADPDETNRTELRQAALGDMESITPEQTQEIGGMLADKILEAQRERWRGSMAMEASPSRELMNRMANRQPVEILERRNFPLEFSKRMEPPRDLTSPERIRMNPAMTPKVAEMVRSLESRAQPEIYRPLHPQGPYPQGHWKQDMLPQGPFQAINPYEGR